MDKDGDGLISEEEADAVYVLRLPPCGNQLTGLDISGQTNLKVIGVDTMPMLTDVCVWILPFPPEGVTVLQTFSPDIQFTIACTGDSL